MKKVTKSHLKTKTGQYLIARHKGLSKTKAAIVAGYDPSNTSKIEKSQMYEALEKKYFKDEVLEQITLRGIASELVKNIHQDDDRGAKNKAIEIALGKIEPAERQEEENDKLIVILKG